MSSCNHNTKVTKIIVSQPCDPCNPCNTCHKCSCDCLCNTPTYSTAGCITMLNTDCVKYNGPGLPDQGILTNDPMTVVVQKLSAGITNVSPAPPAPLVNVTNGDIDERIDYLAQKVEKLNHTLSLDLDVDSLLDLLLYKIQTSPASVTKFARILSFMGNASNFVLPPENITVIAQRAGFQVKWDSADFASYYTVFYKTTSEGSFTKSLNTPANGITVLNLEPETEYVVYVVTISEAGKQSSPSPITVVKTK